MPAFPQKLYEELTKPRDIELLASCPECGAETTDGRCESCDGNEGAENRVNALASDALYVPLLLLGLVMPIFCGVLGAVIFGATGGIVGFLVGLGISKVTAVDLLRERAAKRGLRDARVLQAQRHQSDRDAYDRAAAGYLSWITTVPDVNFEPPKGFVEFLRDYRNATEMDVDLREALQDAVVAQVLGLLTCDSSHWKPLCDAAYTGSAKQREIMDACLEWRRTSGEHVIYTQKYEQMIGDVRKAHDAGVDLEGVPLRLPSPATMLARLRHASDSSEHNTTDLCLLAAESTTYCDALSEEIKKLDLGEREHFASKVRTIHTSLAKEVAKRLRRKPGGPVGAKMGLWLALSPASLMFLGFFGGVAIYDSINDPNRNWGLPVGVGLLIVACLPLLKAIMAIGPARQERKLNRQVAETMSASS